MLLIFLFGFCIMTIYLQQGKPCADFRREEDFFENVFEKKLRRFGGSDAGADRPAV
jgi:hypothetical protein